MSGYLYHALLIAMVIYANYAAEITCHPNEACVINCANQTQNGVYNKHLHCNESSEVKANMSTSLHIICNDYASGCQYLSIVCPLYRPLDNFCRIDCMYDDGCYGVEMLHTDSNSVEVNCMNGNRVCNNMIISNQRKNTMNISCITRNNASDPVCESLDISVHNSATVNLDCSQQAICNNISIDTYNEAAHSAVITISVYDKGALTNSLINGTINTHGLSLYVDTFGAVSDNTFLFDNARSTQSTVNIALFNHANIFQNDFHVLQVPNLAIISDLKSAFSDNNIFGDINRFVDIRNVVISNSYINLPDTAYLNLTNCEITANTMVNATNTYLCNVSLGIIDHSVLNVAHNHNVNLNNVSLRNKTQIFATAVTNKININIKTNAAVTGHSMVDAKYANNFSLTCHGRCDEHFEIYAPMAMGKTFITCIEYGCKSLDLYTQNNANDITFIPLQCPCDEDRKTACIDSWDIYCTYDADTDTYLNKSQFISATQCIGEDGVCCGDIIEAMHEKKCGDDYHYMCAPDVDCFVDCSNVSESHTLFNNFSCNAKSVINGTDATSLAVLCHDGDDACTNLTVLCPKDGPDAVCNVRCDGEKGCNSLHIDAQMTGQFVLDCTADESCVDVRIINSDSVELNCLNNGCLGFDVNAMGSLKVDCAEGLCDGLLLDCTNCDDFIFNCNGAEGICSNSILKAANTTHFELQCSSSDSVNSMTGCHNITAYIPPQNAANREKKAWIFCDYYGCKELNLFILDAAVTDDINFNVTNCPCDADMTSLCVNEWNLYCNGNALQPSVFTKGGCDDDCCGDIIDAFHEPQCSPFNCAVLNDDLCIINCTDLLSHEYICENEVIKANKATGLNVYCDHNINCNNVEVHCPSFHAGIDTADAVCNIYCDGQDNCNNMKVNSNGINKFNFHCNGECNDVSINNQNYNNNTLSINCNGNCNNMNIYDVGHASITILCDDECVLNQLTVNGYGSKQLYINGNGNAIITHSVFNICNMTASNVLFTNNRIDASLCNAQNISLINNNASSNVIQSANVDRLFMDIMASSFSNNTLFVDKVQQFSLNLTSAMITNNTIYADYVHIATMSMSSGTMMGNVINANNALNVFLMNMNEGGAITGNILNMYNASYAFIQNQYIYSSNAINADNISSFLFECSGNFIECGINSTTDYFNLNNSQKLVQFTIGGKRDNSLFAGFGGNIFAENANQIQIIILAGARIESVNSNTLLINGYNSSAFNINNYGSMQNIEMNATFSKQIAVTNYEKGVMNGSVLFCEQSANVNVVNNGNLYQTTINAQNSSRISVKCVDNSVCNVKVNANHATNVFYNSFAANNGNNAFDYYANENSFDLNAQNAMSVNVAIDGFLRNAMTNINGEYAQSISVSVVGLLNNSVINGKNANRLSVECGASDTKYGCHNVSIIASPVNGGTPSSYLSCVQYGCQNLVLFTRNDADDLNVTGSECPCIEDLINLCIHHWEIHCKNDTNGFSIFEGLNNCTGDCCGSVDTELEEDYCIPKKKKKKKWLYVLIGLLSFGLATVAIAVYVYKKSKQEVVSLNT